MRRRVQLMREPDELHDTRVHAQGPRADDAHHLHRVGARSWESPAALLGAACEESDTYGVQECLRTIDVQRSLIAVHAGQVPGAGSSPGTTSRRTAEPSGPASTNPAADRTAHGSKVAETLHEYVLDLLDGQQR